MACENVVCEVSEKKEKKIFPRSKTTAYVNRRMVKRNFVPGAEGSGIARLVADFTIPFDSLYLNPDPSSYDLKTEQGRNQLWANLCNVSRTNLADLYIRCLQGILREVDPEMEASRCTTALHALLSCVVWGPEGIRKRNAYTPEETLTLIAYLGCDALLMLLGGNKDGLQDVLDYANKEKELQISTSTSLNPAGERTGLCSCRLSGCCNAVTQEKCPHCVAWNLRFGRSSMGSIPDFGYCVRFMNDRPFFCLPGGPNDPFLEIMIEIDGWPCRFGRSCRSLRDSSRVCNLVHPPEVPKEEQLCWYGAECKSLRGGRACPHKHPEVKPKPVAMCRYGVKCSSLRGGKPCHFQHPDVERSQQVRQGANSQVSHYERKQKRELKEDRESEWKEEECALDVDSTSEFPQPGAQVPKADRPKKLNQNFRKGTQHGMKKERRNKVNEHFDTKQRRAPMTASDVSNSSSSESDHPSRKVSVWSE